METTNDKLYKGIQWVLFTFLFVYILLRILFTDTLHDEIATYMFYFYHGDYIGENIQWDANNHLLNSFIGHQLYTFFGDNMVILRLPNLLAFVLYFFGTVRLTRDFKTPALNISALVVLNTIPFMMEYFGNARGYGLSLGFFVWALVHLVNHLKNYSIWSLFIGYLFLGLTVSANLTFINTSLMLLVLCIAYPFINKKARPLGMAGREWLLHILFMIGITPFILFGFALRHTGALYYGRLDGIWDVTGKTLSRYVLFMDHDWLRFVYLGVFVVMLIGIIVLIRKLPLAEWIQQPVVVYALLFFGNITAAILLAKILLVNYPEDRTGMYLILFFLMMIFHLIERFPAMKWLQISFVFFPITFATHMSLDTSVFSPDDRLDHTFYETVKSEIKPESTVMIYHIMNWNWPYAESHSDVKSSVAQFDNPNSTLTDILVTKTTVLDNPDIPKLYDTIAYHAPSTYIAFKRKVPLIRVPLDSSEVVNVEGNPEYMEIATFASGAWSGKDLQLTVKGHLETDDFKNKIQLVVQGAAEDGSSTRYYYYSFETTYQSELINDAFLHNFVLEDLNESDKQIKVYLWNRGLHHMELNNVQCTIFELKSPENESR